MDQMLIVLGVFEYVVFLLSVSLHDVAQTWVAYKLGDPTSRMLGRFSMNPAKHFNVWGMGVWPAINLFIYHSPFMLGWSNPIPITTRNLQKPRRDENRIYIAGPATNLLLAVVCLVILLVLKHVSAGVAASLDTAAALAMHVPVETAGLPSVFPIVLILYFGILVNLLLFVFNLVPLPLFDGGKVLRNYLSYNAQKTFDNIGIYLMMGFFFVGFGVIMQFFLPLMGLFDGLLRGL